MHPWFKWKTFSEQCVQLWKKKKKSGHEYLSVTNKRHMNNYSALASLVYSFQSKLKSKKKKKRRRKKSKTYFNLALFNLSEWCKKKKKNFVDNVQYFINMQILYVSL